MIDKDKMRTEIIDFFVKECNNKLNKNVYNINFYKNRNKEHVYWYMQDYFKGTVLEDASIAQKYYHVYWNHLDIPNTKFCNFQIGYRKGKRITNGRSIVSLQNKLNSFEPNYLAISYWNTADAKHTLSNYFTYRKHKKMLENGSLLSYVLFQQQHINSDNYTKIVLYCQDTNFCICGSTRKIIKPSVVLATCGNKKCTSQLISKKAKARDLTYLQTDICKQKRAKSRTGLKQSHETICKRVESNKKFWTPEKRKAQVEQNRKNGTYKKSSDTIKRKILAGDYTPKTQNRLNHKRLSSNITGVTSYRSSWELAYHEANPSLVYEVLRIPYDFKGKRHIYIVDFWDPDRRQAIEIKPSNLINLPKNVAKLNSLAEWCKYNNASYIVITEKDLKPNE